MWLRISKYYDFKFVDEPLIIDYRNPKGMSYYSVRILAGYKSIIEKYFNEFYKIDKRLVARHYFNIGILLCMHESSSHLREGKKYLRKAVKMNPWSFKYIFLAFLSLFRPTALFIRPLIYFNKKCFG